jgi:hypothetical protein
MLADPFGPAINFTRWHLKELLEQQILLNSKPLLYLKTCLVYSVIGGTSPVRVSNYLHQNFKQLNYQLSIKFNDFVDFCVSE